MIHSADILDAAALIALRCDPQSARLHAPSAESVSEVRDSLTRLVEQWRRDLAVGSHLSAVPTRVAGTMPDARSQATPSLPRNAAEGQRRADAVTEILVTELLLRVYAALVTFAGGTAGDKSVSRLVDEVSLTMGNMGQFARQQFMLVYPDFSWSLKLYRLQKRLDRWSDILLAPVLRHSRLERFWMSRQTEEDWSNHPWNLLADRDAAGVLLRRAMKSAVPPDATVAASRSRHIERLLMAALLFIPETDFTADGVLMSWEQRRASLISRDSRPRRVNRLP